eukprot:g2422.t1
MDRSIAPTGVYRENFHSSPLRKQGKNMEYRNLYLKLRKEYDRKDAECDKHHKTCIELRKSVAFLKKNNNSLTRSQDAFSQERESLEKTIVSQRAQIKRLERKLLGNQGRMNTSYIVAKNEELQDRLKEHTQQNARQAEIMHLLESDLREANDQIEVLEKALQIESSTRSNVEEEALNKSKALGKSTRKNKKNRSSTKEPSLVDTREEIIKSKSHAALLCELAHEKMDRERLEKKLMEATECLAKLREKYSEVSTRQRETETQHRELQIKFEDITRKHMQKCASFDDMEKELTALSSERVLLLDYIKNKAMEYEMNTERKENELTKLYNTVNEEENDISELSNKLLLQVEENGQLKSALEEATQMQRTTEDRYAEQAKDLNRLSKENRRLQKIAEMREVLMEKIDFVEKKIRKYAQENHELKKANQSMKKANKESSNEISIHKKMQQSFISNIKTLQEQKSEVDLSLKNALDSYDLVIKENKEMQMICDAQRRDLDESKAKEKVLEKRLRDLQENLKQHQKLEMSMQESLLEQQKQQLRQQQQFQHQLLISTSPSKEAWAETQRIGTSVSPAASSSENMGVSTLNSEKKLDTSQLSLNVVEALARQLQETEMRSQTQAVIPVNIVEALAEQLEEAKAKIITPAKLITKTKITPTLITTPVQDMENKDIKATTDVQALVRLDTTNFTGTTAKSNEENTNSGKIRHPPHHLHQA